MLLSKGWVLKEIECSHTGLVWLPRVPLCPTLFIWQYLNLTPDRLMTLTCSLPQCLPFLGTHMPLYLLESSRVPGTQWVQECLVSLFPSTLWHSVKATYVNQSKLGRKRLNILAIPNHYQMCRTECVILCCWAFFTTCRLHPDLTVYWRLTTCGVFNVSHQIL